MSGHHYPKHARMCVPRPLAADGVALAAGQRGAVIRSDANASAYAMELVSDDGTSTLATLPHAGAAPGNFQVAKLHLNLKGEYFDQIKSGEKVEEYRLCTPFWSKRLLGRNYAGIVLKRGYPKADDTTRILERPYMGWQMKTITHPHFGAAPVTVFAIVVN